MDTQKTEPSTSRSITRTERGGLLPGVVDLALDLADRGQTAAIALLQDARGELRGAVDGGVDLAEKVAAAFFRIARKSVQGADDASAEALTGLGLVLASAVERARDVSRNAAELAAAAASRSSSGSSSRQSDGAAGHATA